MADVKPFKGVRYDEKVVGNIADVICPPYDVISARQEEELHNKNKYNFIKIEHDKHLEGDTEQNNKYTRSAETLESWLKDGALKKDEKAAIYLYDQYFTYNGEKSMRRNIVSAVRLEEWSAGVVKPHENTLKGPKKDRINLIWALAANTSSVFSMYEDRNRQIANLLTEQEKIEPAIDITDDNGERHVVRLINDEETLKRINELFKDKPLYIADGHHRYESALVHRNDRAKCCCCGLSDDNSVNFVMMTLVDFDDPGLLALPTHRLVRGLSDTQVNGLTESLETYFDVAEITGGKEGIDEAFSGGEGVKIILYGLEGEKYFLLTLKDLKQAAKFMSKERSSEYKKLDVSVIDHVILENLIGMDAVAESLVAYDHDIDSSIERVKSGEFQLAFILDKLDPNVIQRIADIKDRMPRKSTYFYPKLPSGLVTHRFF